MSATDSWHDNMPYYTQVTYLAEEIGIRRRLTLNDVADDAIEDKAMEELEAFAISNGAVLIPRRTRIKVKTEFKIEETQWTLMLSPIISPRIIRTDTLIVRAWVWAKVRPEHRERLSQTIVRDNMMAITMMTADG